MLSVRVRPEAEADIAAAAGWYEQQGNALGAEFVLCLDAGRNESNDSIQLSAGDDCHLRPAPITPILRYSIPPLLCRTR